MNTVGWLGGGATAPLIIGFIATYHGLGFGIAIASIVYIAAGVLLVFAATVLARPDVDAMQRELKAIEKPS
jgi:hypothetical protein